MDGGRILRIFTIHSPSHQKYFDMFSESLKGHEIISKVTQQICEPDYNSKDYREYFYLKTLYVFEQLILEKEPFIISDVDIIFFKEFNIELKDNDFIAQYEKHVFGFPTICAGFMCIKPNEKTRKMFAWVIKNLHRFNHDQEAINHYIYTHPFSIKWSTLPKTFYQINYDNGNKTWDGEYVKLRVYDPVLFHYHWTIGDKNRMGLLSMVKKSLNTE